MPQSLIVSNRLVQRAVEARQARQHILPPLSRERVTWLAHFASVESSGLISQSQMLWAHESIEYYTNHILPTADASHAHVSLRATSIFINQCHFAWGAQIGGRYYYGDTLYDDVCQDAWLHLYTVFGLPDDDPLEVTKIPLQKQSGTFCGMFASLYLYLLATGAAVEELSTFSVNERSLFSWFTYCISKDQQTLIPPKLGVEVSSPALPGLHLTKGGQFRIDRKPKGVDPAADALLDPREIDYTRYLSKAISSLHCLRADPNHAFYKHRPRQCACRDQCR